VGATNSTTITTATTATLSLTNIQSASAGTYLVVVSNALGTASSSATLTVNAAPPSFSSVALSGGNVVMKFTSANTTDTTNSYTLESSSVVTGPWTNSTTAVFTTVTGGFQITVGQTGATQFYRLQHN